MLLKLRFLIFISIIINVNTTKNNTLSSYEDDIFQIKDLVVEYTIIYKNILDFIHIMNDSDIVMFNELFLSKTNISDN